MNPLPVKERTQVIQLGQILLQAQLQTEYLRWIRNIAVVFLCLIAIPAFAFTAFFLTSLIN